MKKYSVIYADPPWSYKVYSKKGKGRSAENHYKTMDIEAIKKMRVQDLCADDCVLFLWVTFPNLIEGLDVIKSWGFTYKTCGFNWIKMNKKSNSVFWGLGFWTRANSELCLIGTRGKPKRIDKGVHQVVMSKIERHSKKPNEVRDRIIKLIGDVPRLEMFARQQTPGWDAHGNEIDGGVIIL